MSCVQSQNISITLKVQRGNEIVLLSSTQECEGQPPSHLVTRRTEGHSLLMQRSWGGKENEGKGGEERDQGDGKEGKRGEGRWVGRDGEGMRRIEGS